MRPVRGSKKVVWDTQPVERGEDLRQASRTLGENQVAVLRVTPYVDLIRGKAEFCRNTDSLTATAHEDFGFFNLCHGVTCLLLTMIYIIGLVKESFPDDRGKRR